MSEPWECPICHKTVYVGYTTHRHCLDNLIDDILEDLEILYDNDPYEFDMEDIILIKNKWLTRRDNDR